MDIDSLFKDMEEDLKRCKITDTDLEILNSLREELDRKRGTTFIEYLNDAGLKKDAVEKIKLYHKAKDGITKEYCLTVLNEYYQSYKDAIPGAQDLKTAFHDLMN